jgi:hypothetical protein
MQSAEILTISGRWEGRGLNRHSWNVIAATSDTERYKFKILKKLRVQDVGDRRGE